MTQDPSPLITYRRKGRVRRASGYVRDRNAPTGCLKVEPCNPNWKPVWVSPEEVRDGEDGPKRPAKPRSARKESSEPVAGDRTPETTPGDSREPTGHALDRPADRCYPPLAMTTADPSSRLVWTREPDSGWGDQHGEKPGWKAVVSEMGDLLVTTAAGATWPAKKYRIQVWRDGRPVFDTHEVKARLGDDRALVLTEDLAKAIAEAICQNHPPTNPSPP